jgi:hypothetical protein
MEFFRKITAMKTTLLIAKKMKSLNSENRREFFINQVIKKSFLSLLMLFFALNISAQTLQEYGDMIATMKASPDPAIRIQADHLDSLVFKTQSKIYIKNFVEEVYGDTPPVCLQTDAQSVGMLSQAKPLYQTVELITINLNGPNDLNFVLDLAALPGFESLKYVHFFCSYECNPQSIGALFLSNNPGITVFYSISIAN